MRAWAAILLAAALSAHGAGPLRAQDAPERGAAPRWWAGLQFGLASPTSDLGKVSDSGPQYALSVGRRLGHPVTVRATVTHVPLLEGGIPKSFGDGPFGPETDLWIVTAGPSLELTPRGRDPVEVELAAVAGLTVWESGGSELTPAFTDTDLTGGVLMDVVWTPGRRWWALLAHVDAYGIWGDLFGEDDNPFSKEFLHGFAVGGRFRF